MFEIDKEKFGTFVAGLRKELGLTQKELAERLYLSDKAVSKWERGLSMPDITMLMPLAEILGVSVTELLECRRLEPAQTLDAVQVETLVKKTITLSEDSPEKAARRRKRRGIVYVCCLIAAFVELALMKNWGMSVEELFEMVGLGVGFGAGFGAYALFFAKERLPAYYDENYITTYNDGPVRMNLAFIPINNSNWPHILHAIQVWALCMMAVFPAVYGLVRLLIPGEIWRWAGFALVMGATLGGLFVPTCIVGKKYA